MDFLDFSVFFNCYVRQPSPPRPTDESSSRPGAPRVPTSGVSGDAASPGARGPGQEINTTRYICTPRGTGYRCFTVSDTTVAGSTGVLNSNWKLLRRACNCQLRHVASGYIVYSATTGDHTKTVFQITIIEKGKIPELCRYLDTSVGSVSSASSSTHRPWAQLRGTACSVRLRGSGADLGLKAEALELRGDQAEALRRRRQGHRTRGRRSRRSRRVLLGRRVRRRWVGLQRRRRCRCKRHGGTPERGARRLAWLSALRRQPS